VTEAVQQKPSPHVPRWLVVAIWKIHRFAYAVTGGRFGLRTPTTTRWGMLRLTTVGRRTGNRRAAILGYVEDGANLVIPAMNGWADPEPAWWLNLQTHPEATVMVPNGRKDVIARAAVGEERERLWRSLVDLGSAAYTDANAALRSRPPAIVVLEPRPA
jgi:deazaflavin-dependent oxidoreductase (nitroreductase family)